MRQKADDVYQVTLKEKRIFMSRCNNTKQKELVTAALVDADKILQKNSLSVNFKKMQHRSEQYVKLLSKKKELLENDISRLDRNLARDLANIERERQKSHDDINRRIRELERQK